MRAAHTGSDILEGLDAIAPLSQEDAKVFLEVVSANRAGESWEQRDLR